MDSDISILNNILKEFGLEYVHFISLLEDTSAVLIGGAVTHYLYNYLNSTAQLPFPESSDLDFLVYVPDVKGGVYYRHAFMNLVIERFKRTLNPLGFYYTRKFQDHDKNYQDLLLQLVTKAGVKIRVHWFVHPITKRYMNLIFTDTNVQTMLDKSDIQLSRAFIAPIPDIGFKCVHHDLVIQDLRDRKLTPPLLEFSGDTTPDRVQKYLSRYTMTLRDSDPTP